MVFVNRDAELRELPFGESIRSTKKTLYRIQDPAVRFWCRVFSPHQSWWRTYSTVAMRKLIHDHAATVFEDLCRSRFPGALRHWEGNLETPDTFIDDKRASPRQPYPAQMVAEKHTTVPSPGGRALPG